MKAPDPATIVEGFPNPIIPKISGKPNFEQLQQLVKLLKQNAASVATTLGGGLLGHLGILLTILEYATVSNTPFAPPPNPGLSPVVPQGTTAAQTGFIIRQHDVILETAVC